MDSGDRPITLSTVTAWRPERTMRGDVDFTAVTLAPVPREHVLVPAPLLASLDRLGSGITRHHTALLRAGMRLTRGVLIFGPAGSGKTFLARHLITTAGDRTNYIVSGRTRGLLAATVHAARVNAPATIVVEDVDQWCEGPDDPFRDAELDTLLDTLDGPGEDTDLLVVMTTSHADRLSPSLALRPGRVDLAIEMQALDHTARQDLLEQLLAPCTVRGDLRRLAARTHGANPAFLTELVRRATLIALDAAATGGGRRRVAVVVSDDDLDRAFDELMATALPLIARLQPGTITGSGPADAPKPPPPRSEGLVRG
jgi:SpoVK/Ycf46/Vps4 family AAA+-type ATPase